MKPLYTQEEFDNAKSTSILPLCCSFCNCTFYVKRSLISYEIMKERNYLQCCSRSCTGHLKNKHLLVVCKNCNKEFLKSNAARIKSKNNFCSRSCSVSYNNKNKTSGTRRSKLEKWIEEKLTALYPDLKIDFNKKDIINSELDIYIPSLKLAIELNGIYHYEPIHGQNKLNSIQNNDNRKFQACLEKQIEFAIIDTSQHKYFKEKYNIKYLDIITNIINQKINTIL